MIKPKIPDNEHERLQALRSLDILDTEHEERFDRITRMAKRMFGVPISLVSLVDHDRQWFKSAQGLDATETSREISFCGHAINEDKLFVVPNAVNDDRFFDNPLVTDEPNIRFYAGCPIKLRENIQLGTLCLIDRKPRDMDEEDKQLLKDLAEMVEHEIQAVQMATLDELTMISNRRGFHALAEHSLKVCKRRKTPFSLLLFDLDKFKPINDTYGHQEGDWALLSFAKAMKQVFRGSDVIARIGGDEFAVLLAELKPDDLQFILNRFKEEIDTVNRNSNKPYQIQYSVGSASFESDSDLSLDQMIDLADQSMYQQKQARSA